VLGRASVRPLLALASIACTPAATAPEAKWPPLAQRWYDRARASYQHGDFEDAGVAIDNAMRLLPKEPAVRVLAARVALAELEYDRVGQLLEGLVTSDARAVRGRACWYAGQVDRAADELEELLRDPDVRDTWAQAVARLARRGSGRRPFRVGGAMLAAVEMPQVSGTALVVPLELNGEPGLAMIATNSSEVVVDSQGSGDPSWVSLRFGERFEVRDVPALARDLSGLSRQLDAPIKALLGVNLLRHLHPTLDFRGAQFVVRSFDPPPPPQATTVKLSYVRGGGMMLRSPLGSEQGAPVASLLVDTSMTFPVALDDAGWQTAGVALGTLRSVPSAGALKQGVLPLLRLGAFDVPRIPGVHGAPVAELERSLDIDLDGLVGSGLLAEFRVTLVDGGKTMWMEGMPAESVAPSVVVDTALSDEPDEEEPLPREPPPPPVAAPPAAKKEAP
jgi:hypothetical protein